MSDMYATPGFLLQACFTHVNEVTIELQLHTDLNFKFIRREND